ncbi:hypothetical protein KSP35_17050 [Aquihabitans sp. G128]|uniref:hypothetical protein n=1 Tax=Aquihabitans sp. G128 TaxID=2849779 RepID=UPI001C21D773|nr:hypothetical protein [Aquihabitans sp. G128]QXC60057.1 hypothetical protein KSP35_17050 [Aquihabitans sp. G128]
MVTPRQQINPDATPEADKANILRRAGVAARKRAKAEADEMLAIRLANLAGASTREIGEATERSHATVARMLQRSAPEAD